MDSEHFDFTWNCIGHDRHGIFDFPNQTLPEISVLFSQPKAGACEMAQDENFRYIR